MTTKGNGVGRVLLSLFIFSFLLARESQCRDIEREITVEVKAGTEECFYEMVKAGETMDVEYQVSGDNVLC